MDILTIGEVLIDLTQTGRDERGIPQFAANPGGAPANLAVAAARLGAQTAFIGKVGADAFGRYLTEVLQENKVDISGVTRDISLMLLPETQVGDYVLVHAGFVIQKVTEQEVAETNALRAEMNGAPRTVTGIAEEAGGTEI